MKKRSITLMLILFISTISFAQIGILKTNKNEHDKKVEIDCPDTLLTNFLSEDVYCYKNQLLYVLPKTKSLQKYGYDYFYKTKKMEKKYACCQSYNSRYESLANRYFYVTEINHHPKYKTSILYAGKYYFTLKDKDTDEIVYFEYSSKYEDSFPFLSVTYFEKHKNDMNGTKIILRGGNWRGRISSEYDKIYDINNGKEVLLDTGEVWTVGELVVEDKYNTLSYVISNNKGEVTTIQKNYLNNGINEFSVNQFIIFKKDADGIKKECEMCYNSIIKREIMIGMTEEMVKLSWGKPDKINTSSYGSDQWIYNNRYLYFENSKLKSWN